jgi:hydroxymethylbilane synthase
MELVEVKTLGEKFPQREIPEIGVGVFTRELDARLLSGDIDLAVHSLKDVPSEIPDDVALAAVPPRESPWDAFISTEGTKLDALAPGSRVGTGSPRRRAQLLHHRPDLEIVSLRGNVATRLAKQKELALSGILLAHAGLIRLGKESLVTHLVPPAVLLPAVSQGALGITARKSDNELLKLLNAVDHGPSHSRARAERGFLRRLRGGCQVPVGALATLEADGTLLLQAAITAPDGSACVRGEIAGDPEYAEGLGCRLGDELLERGGAAILESLAGGGDTPQ